jgi:HEAT repeat protein
MKLLHWLFGEPPDTFALQQQGDRAGLIAALGHTFPWVRRDAAQALGELRDPHARAMLRAALNDSDAEVRHAAHTALETLRR